MARIRAVVRRGHDPTTNIVDGARSRERGGAGLGLAICRTIARAHGGDITVRSVPGEGSTFVVTLPTD